MKGIKILVLKGFNVVYVKSMVGKLYGLLVYIENRKVKKYL